MNTHRGFTLIEVMMAVAILAIIAAIAIPSYNSYAMKARRAEATILLTEISGEQYRYFSEQNRYATKLTELGYAADTIDTENQHYQVTVSASSPSSYTLRASPKTGSSQSKDTKCTEFTINSVGVKATKPVANAQECW